MKGSGHGLIKGTIPESACRDWGKLCTFSVSHNSVPQMLLGPMV
jgi:hypothetical protein